MFRHILKALRREKSTENALPTTESRDDDGADDAGEVKISTAAFGLSYEPSGCAVVFCFQSEDSLRTAYDALGDSSQDLVECRVAKSREILFPYWMICSPSNEEEIRGKLAPDGDAPWGESSYPTYFGGVTEEGTLIPGLWTDTGIESD